MKWIKVHEFKHYSTHSASFSFSGWWATSAGNEIHLRKRTHWKYSSLLCSTKYLAQCLLHRKCLLSVCWMTKRPPHVHYHGAEKGDVADRERCATEVLLHERSCWQPPTLSACNCFSFPEAWPKHRTPPPSNDHSRGSQCFRSFPSQALLPINSFIFPILSQHLLPRKPTS